MEVNGKFAWVHSSSANYVRSRNKSLVQKAEKCLKDTRWEYQTEFESMHIFCDEQLLKGIPQSGHRLDHENQGRFKMSNRWS
jgi:hypothetical protein